MEFGLLGMIIYHRAARLHENWFNGDKTNKSVLDQLKIGGYVPRGGIPADPLEFLVFISQRLMNIANSSSKLVDSILPSLHEIHYCITHNLVTKKEAILFKVLLDFYECTSEKE
jgi:hypothetical protein